MTNGWNADDEKYRKRRSAIKRIRQWSDGTARDEREDPLDGRSIRGERSRGIGGSVDFRVTLYKRGVANAYACASLLYVSPRHP